MQIFSKRLLRDIFFFLLGIGSAFAITYIVHTASIN